VPSLGFAFSSFFLSSLRVKAMLKTCHTQPFPHTSSLHIFQAFSSSKAFGFKSEKVFGEKWFLKRLVFTAQTFLERLVLVA
jgi:hypothetical protein